MEEKIPIDSKDVGDCVCYRVTTEPFRVSGSPYCEASGFLPIKIYHAYCVEMCITLYSDLGKYLALQKHVFEDVLPSCKLIDHRQYVIG